MPFDVSRRGFVLAGCAAALAPALPRPAQALQDFAYPAPERELMVPVAGGRIYVRVNGRLDGPRPPLLAMHGGPGGTHASMIELLRLAGERAVILYDQLDGGRSEHPGNPANWRVERFVDEVEAIRRALNIRRWHVIGHSWGGTIALEYGARRPPALAGLVLGSPLVSTRSWLADTNLLRTRLPRETRAVLERCDPPATFTPECDAATTIFNRTYNRRETFNTAVAAYRRDRIGRGFNMRVYEAMWGRTEFIATGTLRDYDGEPRLARLDGRRTLFITGQYDEARPATISGFVDRVPGADFAVVPGAAHGFLDDRAETSIGILRPWLARQDAA